MSEGGYGSCPGGSMTFSFGGLVNASEKDNVDTAWGSAAYGSNVGDGIRDAVIQASRGVELPGNIIFQNYDGDEIMRIVPGPPARIIVADGVDVDEGAKAILSALEIAFGRRSERHEK